MRMQTACTLLVLISTAAPGNTQDVDFRVIRGEARFQTPSAAQQDVIPTGSPLYAGTAFEAQVPPGSTSGRSRTVASLQNGIGASCELVWYGGGESRTFIQGEQGSSTLEQVLRIHSISTVRTLDLEFEWSSWIQGRPTHAFASGYLDVGDDGSKEIDIVHESTSSWHTHQSTLIVAPGRPLSIRVVVETTSAAPFGAAGFVIVGWDCRLRSCTRLFPASGYSCSQSNYGAGMHLTSPISPTWSSFRSVQVQFSDPQHRLQQVLVIGVAPLLSPLVLSLPPGCTLFVDPLLILPFQRTDPNTGTSSSIYDLESLPDGVPLYFQAVAFEPSAPFLGTSFPAGVRY